MDEGHDNARGVTTQGTQARKRCEGGKMMVRGVKDASEAASPGRRQRAREGIIVASLLLKRRALILRLLVINIFFSTFNDVDLSHSMLVDCCMFCCRECGPIAAV
jgi:hypothetical protein